MKKNVGQLAYLQYRFARKLVHHYRNLTLAFLNLRYRFFRKLAHRYSRLISYLIQVRCRFVRKVRFRAIRLMVFFMWRLWLRRVYGMDNIPEREAAIVVSNHNSYYDFFVLASVLKRQTVFVAVKGLNQRTFVGWFMKLDTIIYVDRDNPGYSFLKEVIRQLHQKKIVVVYPEGTRSRSGKMLVPKNGFVKLAIKVNVPIIPVAMRGTYDILPPHRHLPKFKKCDVQIGEKIYISPSTPLLRDIFFQKRGSKKFTHLNDDQLSEIAFRIMNQVRLMSGQKWDDSALEAAAKYGLYDRNHQHLAREPL
ncbi:MAG: 1-acyl-sn-glycerol-3-phosphate acyltransferase [Candidatus Omnitrophica bacterium]|nr:1-acyl-sn-glycerol-3-phosphate acyltransferase [Candidatus Omnitrophota bacterium]